MFAVRIYVEAKSAFKENRVLRDDTYFLPQLVNAYIVYVPAVNGNTTLLFLEEQNFHQHKDQGGLSRSGLANNSYFLLAFHCEAKVL